MRFSVPELLKRIGDSEFLFRVRAEIIGLAQDFWKDAEPAEPEKKKEKKQNKVRKEKVSASVADEKAKDTPVQNEQSTLSFSGRWCADRVQVKEKIWGEGRTLPGNDDLDKKLVDPLNLKKGMEVLDLSAGLGGLARTLASEYGVSVTGLEMDEAIARRGMEMSTKAGKANNAVVEVYDPATFTAAKNFDCILARELFFRIPGKEKFFQTISSSLKPQGMMVFTDYILEKNARSNEAVAIWLKNEIGTAPLSLEEMVNSWRKVKIELRVNEDLTDLYLKEIKRKLKEFIMFLAKNRPGEETGEIVLKETILWARRAKAMEQGLKFFRFESARK